MLILKRTLKFRYKISPQHPAAHGWFHKFQFTQKSRSLTTIDNVTDLDLDAFELFMTEDLLSVTNKNNRLSNKISIKENNTIFFQLIFEPDFSDLVDFPTRDLCLSVVWLMFIRSKPITSLKKEINSFKILITINAENKNGEEIDFKAKILFPEEFIADNLVLNHVMATLQFYHPFLDCYMKHKITRINTVSIYFFTE